MSHSWWVVDYFKDNTVISNFNSFRWNFLISVRFSYVTICDSIFSKNISSHIFLDLTIFCFLICLVSNDSKCRVDTTLKCGSVIGQSRLTQVEIIFKNQISKEEKKESKRWNRSLWTYERFRIREFRKIMKNYENNVPVIFKGSV